MALRAFYVLVCNTAYTITFISATCNIKRQVHRKGLSWKMCLTQMLQQERLAKIQNYNNCYCKENNQVRQSSYYCDPYFDLFSFNSTLEYLWDDNIFVKISISCNRNAQIYTQIFLTITVLPSLAKEIIARVDMGSWWFIIFTEIIYLRQRMSLGRSRDARIIDIKCQS